MKAMKVHESNESSWKAVEIPKVLKTNFFKEYN